MIYLLLIFFWLVFFTLHSFTASHGFKQWFLNHYPRVFPYYRLIYNVVSLLTLLAPLSLVYIHPGPMLWEWRSGAQIVANALAGIGLLGFVLSAGCYDNARFLGFKPNHNPRVDVAEEPFSISTLHRFVRHPWYFFGLLLIWTRDMSLSWFITCILGTLYLYLGSLLEEHKLMIEHGDAYRRYRQRVPGLFPLPWRYLSRAEADQLQQR